MKKWFGLNEKGDIQYLGEFADFNAVASWDDENENTIVWIMSEESLRDWQEQINQLVAEHLPPVTPE